MVSAIHWDLKGLEKSSLKFDLVHLNLGGLGRQGVAGPSCDQDLQEGATVDFQCHALFPGTGIQWSSPH